MPLPAAGGDWLRGSPGVSHPLGFCSHPFPWSHRSSAGNPRCQRAAYLCLLPERQTLSRKMMCQKQNATKTKKKKITRRYKRTKPARGIWGKGECNYLGWRVASKQGLMQKQGGVHPPRRPEQASGTRGGRGLSVVFHWISAVPGNRVAPCWNIKFWADLKNRIAYWSLSIINYSGQSRKQKGFKGWQDYEAWSSEGEGEGKGERAILETQVVLRNSPVALQSCPSLLFQNPPKVPVFCLTFLSYGSSNL